MSVLDGKMGLWLQLFGKSKKICEISLCCHFSYSTWHKYDDFGFSFKQTSPKGRTKKNPPTNQSSYRFS